MKFIWYGKNGLCIIVAPFAGARIEIYLCKHDWELLLSLPSRERGLKYTSVSMIGSFCSVAPFAGARIEIIMELEPVAIRSGRSLRGSAD